MNRLNSNKVYFAILEYGNDGQLAYQIGEKLTVGIDPRNDIILSGENVEQKHIELSERNGQIILNQIAENDTTFINKTPLKNNEQYLINENDIIKIDKFLIKFKKDFGGLKETKESKESKESKIPIPPIEQSKNIHSNKGGINLKNNQEDEVVSSQMDKKATFIKRPNSLNKDKTYLIKLEKINFVIPWDFVTKFFLGLIFDFFFSYFILSMVSGFKIHILLFFSFVEIILMFTFKSTAGQFLFRHKFNRQYTIWILILLFLVYPLSKGSFSKNIVINKIPAIKTIDIHPVPIISFSNFNKLNLTTELDRNLFILPNIRNDKVNFLFYNSKDSSLLKMELVDTYDSIKINKFIYRSHPFKLPIKEKIDGLQLKNNFLNLILFKKENLKKVFMENGPFLTFINDSKTFFTQGLDKKIELIEQNENSPIIILRDEFKANIFIIGNDSVYFYQYIRPVDTILETEFIEKFIGKIAYTLVNRTNANNVLINLLDNSTNLDYQQIYKYYSNIQIQVKEGMNKNLITFYNALIEQIEIEYIKNTNNTDQVLLKNFDQLKIQE